MQTAELHVQRVSWARDATTRWRSALEEALAPIEDEIRARQDPSRQLLRDSADLPGGVGDEAAPSAVARAAVEAEGPVPDGEQVDDRRGAGPPGSFGRD